MNNPSELVHILLFVAFPIYQLPSPTSGIEHTSPARICVYATAFSKRTSAGALGYLPYLSDQVGSTWGQYLLIDVVGINWMEKTPLLEECKWTFDAVERKAMAQLLEEKTAKVVTVEGP